MFLSKFTWYVPGVGGMFILLAWLLVGALVGNIVVAVDRHVHRRRGREWNTPRSSPTR